MGILVEQRNDITKQAPAIAGKIAIGIIVFFVLYIAINIIVAHIQKKIMSNDTSENKYSQKHAEFIGKIIFLLLVIFDILICFQIVGFDAGIIMGGISLSLGFAMQSTIENLVAGVMIITNQKIKIGEFIQFMEPLKIMGTVEEINIRYTVVKTYDKRKVIIPNSLVAKTPIRTMKSEPLLRGDFRFMVGRHTPIEAFKQTFISTINANKHITHPEYTNILINNFTDRGIELKGYFFVNPVKKSPSLVARDIKKSLFETMKKYGIEIPYPHITLTTE